MKRKRLLRTGVPLAACAALVALLTGPAGAARVELGHLVLRADGGFEPRSLPRRAYAPIRFQGHADIASKTGARPPALRQVRLDFDRDGRLSTRGLAVCPPGRIEGATPKAARRKCRAAIVGRGNIEAMVSVPGQRRVTVRSPLTLFNGPRRGGSPTAVAHARANFPAPETYVVVVPIESSRRGAFSYRSTFEVPELAGGHGSLTHIDAKIGRSYGFRGKRRSYTSARCPDYILETRGRFTFDDGTVIDGTVFKPCNQRP